MNKYIIFLKEINNFKTNIQYEYEEIRKSFSLQDIKKLENENKLIFDYVKKNEPLFAKKDKNAIIPTKRHEDICYDIYACIPEGDYVRITPGETKLIPTGICSATSILQGFELKERGSFGSKGLALRCGEIDSGFRGEWFVCLNNTSNKNIIIRNSNKDFKIFEDEEVIICPKSKAICSAKLVDVNIAEIKEISYEGILKIPSVRKEGKLGSSNK